MSVNYTSAGYQGAFPNSVCEEDGSPTERADRDRFSATVVLRVAWNLRYELYSDIMDGQIIYPRRSFPILLPTTCEIRRAGGKTMQVVGTEGANYENALLTITYETLPNSGQDDPDDENDDVEVMFTEEWDEGVEMRPLNHLRYKWETAPNTALTPEEAPATQVPVGVMTQTLLDLEPGNTRISASRDLVGKVNTNTFRSRIYPFTATAETLLCVGWSPTVRQDTLGRLFITVTTTFEYRRDGWNKIYRADIEGFDRLIRRSDNSVTLLYPRKADFSGGMVQL